MTLAVLVCQSDRASKKTTCSSKATGQAAAPDKRGVHVDTRLVLPALRKPGIWVRKMATSGRGRLTQPFHCVSSRALGRLLRGLPLARRDACLLANRSVASLSRSLAPSISMISEPCTTGRGAIDGAAYLDSRVAHLDHDGGMSGCRTRPLTYDMRHRHPLCPRRRDVRPSALARPPV